MNRLLDSKQKNKPSDDRKLRKSERSFGATESKLACFHGRTFKTTKPCSDTKVSKSMSEPPV